MSKMDEQIALALARAERLKSARDEAERLLEQKSRELFEVNQALEAAQLGLEEEIREATTELSVANKKLQRTLDERSTFIGQMSHEVRTPLNAIMGLSEILLATQLDATQNDYLSTINNAASSLVRLLEDMLDISKIEAGKMELHLDEIETHRFFQDVVSMFGFDAKAKGLLLDLDISASVPGALKLDKGRYRQIVNNLVSNAIKNTDAGSVTLKLDYRAGVHARRLGELTLKVIDTGVGIPIKEREKIFNTYQQLGSPANGAGLGLAICSQLCNLMHGELLCESVLGQGSEFIISIPAEMAEQSDSVAKEQVMDVDTKRPKLKILVAEDNPTNQIVLKAQLAQLGQSAEFVDNGVKAIRRLRKETFDIVFVDIIMPVMDGEDTIQVIRGTESELSEHYCIALTASSYADQKQRLIGLGFDAFLSKPLSISQLSQALELYSQTRLEQGRVTSEPNNKDALDGVFDPRYWESQFGDAWGVIFVDVAPTFISHTDADLIELRAAAVDGQTERVSRISHSLKGGSSSVGLVDFSERFEQLEKEPNSIKTAERLEAIDQLWLSIRKTLLQELSRLGLDEKI